ncbi:hypothetical protein [Grimontia hollisae]|uniref:hypothetical protein n=1 Tax=Grimontia hollisae TaxID=673 RepID=UPI0012AC5C45|nr:hypothetical protein [Grimontia hollisae]
MDKQKQISHISANLKAQSENLTFLQSELDRNRKKLALKPFIGTFERMLEVAELQHHNQLHLFNALNLSGGANE